MTMPHRIDSSALSRSANPPAGWFRRLSWVAAAVVLLTAGCGADTTPGEVENDPDIQEEAEVAAPDVVADIETVVEGSTATAGEPIDVECEYVDPVGNPVAPADDWDEDERVLTYPNNAFESTDDPIVAIRAGQVELACQNQQLGMTDFEPAAIEVEPAEAVVTRADLADHQIVAGEDVQASCIGFDEYDNPITDADFELTPDSSAGVEISDQELTATITEAGTTGFSCHLDDASERFGDIVEVLPDRPAELQIAPVPDQEIYNTGQIITVGTQVEDQFGNRISNPVVDYESGVGHEVLGEGRFRYEIEGTHTISAEVVEPTHQDQQLFEEFEVVVNESGPDVACTSPANGEMIVAEEGDEIPVEGTVSDDYDIQEVTIESTDVTLDADDRFETTVTAEYGVNFVEITATDEFDQQNVHTCAFMASPHYHESDDEVGEGVSLELGQTAVDDGEYDGSFSWQIQSLNDLIQTVLRSDELEDELAQQMYDQSPFEVEIDYYLGSCTYDVHVEDFELGDDHTSSLDLIDGGLHMPGGDGDDEWDDDTLIYEIVIDLDIRHSSCPNYSTTVTIDWISVDLQADVQYFSWYDHPEVDLTSVDAESGHISLSGWIGSAIETFAQGTLQDAVEEEIEDAVEDNFDELFDDLLESISSYTASFSVPRLGGGSSIPMDFTVGMAGIDFIEDEEAQFDLDAGITTDDDSGPYLPSEGVAYPPPEDDFQGLPDRGSAHVGGGVHIALLNQALHQLWQAGLFHDEFGGDTISGLDIDLPEGAAVDIQADLPPLGVVHQWSDAELMFGALTLEIEYPGIFDDPVAFEVGAVATTDIVMSADAVDFDKINIEELHFSTDEAALDAETHEVLENFFTALLQDVIDQTVNSALPSIPIPAFEIPSSMTQYGLPSGDLGLVDSDYDQTDTHMEITGDFGIQ